MNADKLRKLIQIDLTTFDSNENNVKHQIVIPFMDLFEMGNHKFEHVPQGSRIRIDIKSGRIIIETKALNENLDIHIPQLKNYSDKEESAVLSLLTNGRQWRIYSPHWIRKSTFKDRLIYKFEITDLKDDELLKRLEKILGYSNYRSDEYIEHIEQRQTEIIKAEREIEEIRKEKNEQLLKLETEKNELEEQVKLINKQIEGKRQEIFDIRNEDNIQEIQEKIKGYYLPVNKLAQIVLPAQPIYSEMKVPNAMGKRLVLNGTDGVLAYGQQLSDGFVVFEGSTIRKEMTDKLKASRPKLVARRKQWEEKGTIVNYTFTEQVVFNSISEAATFVLGISANGNVNWKNDNSHKYDITQKNYNRTDNVETKIQEKRMNAEEAHFSKIEGAKEPLLQNDLEKNRSNQKYIICEDCGANVKVENIEKHKDSKCPAIKKLTGRDKKSKKQVANNYHKLDKEKELDNLRY